MHQWVHSQILTLFGDMSLDTDLDGFEGPLYSSETQEDSYLIYHNMENYISSSATLVQFAAAGSTHGPEPMGPSERPRPRLQHSQSMDGSKTIKPTTLGCEETPSDSKKDAKLAELALHDPKRVKRILANRQSAARSKEKKMKYIAELERKVQTLQTETSKMSAKVTLLQRDMSCMTAENRELRLRLQTMEQQVSLKDALMDVLKAEIQHLKAVSEFNRCGR